MRVYMLITCSTPEFNLSNLSMKVLTAEETITFLKKEKSCLTIEVINSSPYVLHSDASQNWGISTLPDLNTPKK